MKRVIASHPQAHQRRLKEFVDQLAEDPFLSRPGLISGYHLDKTNFDVIRCKGHNSRFRASFGDFRLVCEVDEEERIVLLLKLEFRGEVYSEAVNKV
ncbi:type II toxin-antitoxin system RelE family toxin [Candidatus Methanocrinis natronophilus]|uniref:Type II toxin-antitoxin system RelE/ParE family toxin n=1 Tax=Candidatus Methanocrinis natronophilus TaxID=3033396 RepID=A0ABT5X7G7_9EURY|nr:type II toxin-antitoxin system RelE/ParE family toxin [Candidatus Methanocrinis natronophilus]MDF0590644.1 type II toxin-antitoxin system RelE/ParE family toxin [Candidatus Methanocrinis natronophilus]